MRKLLERALEAAAAAAPEAAEVPEIPKVLLVDDDAEVLRLLQGVVEAAGYEVSTATNGINALYRMEQSTASIVITDLNMPEMGGLELCRRIRARSGGEYVYVMVLSIRDGEADVLAGLEAGADDYLSKRTPATQFTARVRTARRLLALESSWKAATEQRRPMAIKDALTGVHNRRYFILKLSRDLKRVQRFGGDLSMILLDIDGFNSITETFGSAAAETVLTKLSQHIARSFNGITDWCARLGEEGFVIVLRGTGLESARRRAESLRQRIAAAPIETSAGPVSIAVSIGMSGIGEATGIRVTSVDALLQAARSDLHASRVGSRNRRTGANRAPLALAPVNSPAP